MPRFRDLSPRECRALIATQSIARVAVTTPEGPHIVPVNIALHEDTVVIRTSGYSALATYGRDATVALETDAIDPATQSGWSVVVRGACRAETDPKILATLRENDAVVPWASGTRNLILRISLASMTGRMIDPAPVRVPTSRTSAEHGGNARTPVAAALTSA